MTLLAAFVWWCGIACVATLVMLVVVAVVQWVHEGLRKPPAPRVASGGAVDAASDDAFADAMERLRDDALAGAVERLRDREYVRQVREIGMLEDWLSLPPRVPSRKEPGSW